MEKLLSDWEVAEDRRLALANLEDTCRIERMVAGRGVFNETTGQYDDPDTSKTLIYQGPCKIQIQVDVNSNIVEPVEVEREWGYQTSTLIVPVVAPVGAQGDPGDVETDDVCTMLTSRYDPALPGRVFNVHTAYHKSLASTRRFKLREPVR